MRTAKLAALVAVFLTTAGLAGAAEADAAELGSHTFTYDGATQSIQVPAGATQMSVQITGGSGGNGWNVDGPAGKPAGGLGATVQGWYSISPDASTLTAYVGGAGQSSFTNPYKFVAGPTAGGWGYTTGGAGGASSNQNDNVQYGQGGAGGGSSALFLGDTRIAVAGGGGGGGGGETGDGSDAGPGGNAGATPQNGADSREPGHGGAAASIAAGDGGDGGNIDNGGPGGGGGAGAPATGGGGAGGTTGSNKNYGGGGGGGAGSSDPGGLTLAQTTTAATAGNGSITVTFYNAAGPDCSDATMALNGTASSSMLSLPGYCQGLPVTNWQLVEQPPSGTATVFALNQSTGSAAILTTPGYTGAVSAVFRATSALGYSTQFRVTFLLFSWSAQLAQQGSGLVMDSSLPNAVIGAAPNGSDTQLWRMFNNPNGTITMMPDTASSGCLTATWPAIGDPLQVNSCSDALQISAEPTGSGVSLSTGAFSFGFGPPSNPMLVLQAQPGPVWQLQAARAAGLGAARHPHGRIRIGWVKLGGHRVRMPLGRSAGDTVRWLLHAPAGSHVAYRAHGAWHGVGHKRIVTVRNGEQFRIGTA